jgi:hypothetical protein
MDYFGCMRTFGSACGRRQRVQKSQGGPLSIFSIIFFLKIFIIDLGQLDDADYEYFGFRSIRLIVFLLYQKQNYIFMFFEVFLFFFWRNLSFFNKTI